MSPSTSVTSSGKWSASSGDLESTTTSSPLFDESVDHIPTDEARSAGDEVLHDMPIVNNSYKTTLNYKILTVEKSGASPSSPGLSPTDVLPYETRAQYSVRLDTLVKI